MTFQGLIWDGLRWSLETTAGRNSAETTARRTEKQLFHASRHSHTSTGEFGVCGDKLHMPAWATLLSGPILSSFVYCFHLQLTHVPGFSGWHIWRDKQKPCPEKKTWQWWNQGVGVSGRTVPGEPGAVVEGGRKWECCFSQVLKAQLANLETNRKCNPGVHTFLLKFFFSYLTLPTSTLLWARRVCAGF